MMKVVMEKFGLDITMPYYNLYYFDARKVKCDGLIKDIVATLTQLDVNSIMMDVVLANVPANYGMILSRTWPCKFQVTMWMDMNSSTIPVSGGENQSSYT